MNKIILFVGLVILFGAIVAVFKMQDAPPRNPDQIRYLPLGDSYTIGQGVEEAERWPNLLVDRLLKDGKDVKLILNPARTGYTTDDLIRSQLLYAKTLDPDFVTVLIGVNDYVQGRSLSEFNNSFGFILDELIMTLGSPDLIVVVTIPDCSLTPIGKNICDSGDGRIADWNEVIIREAEERLVKVADIYEISLGVASDPSLTAEDELHPSAKQYVLWEEVIYNQVKEVLKRL